MARRRRDFWLAELAWGVLVGVGFLVHLASHLAGEVILLPAILIGLVPPVVWLRAVRGGREAPTVPAQPGVRRVNRSAQ